MARTPWIRMHKKSKADIPVKAPIRLGNFSNGEYFHAQTPIERKIHDEIMARADANARKLGMDRRDFLASAMGMATSLTVLNLAASCSSSRSGTSSGGGYQLPPDATLNCASAEDVLNGKGEFIFDIQTHHLEHDGAWRTTDPNYGTILAAFFAQYNGCTESDQTLCIDENAYLQQVFLNSDTAVAVLSGFPYAICTDGGPSECGSPLDNDALAKSMQQFNALGRSQRVVNHCQVNPTDDLPVQLAMMERIKSEYGVFGWKTYPEWGPTGKGWLMTDPNSGIPMIEKARELDVKIICIHKGIVFPGWDASTSDPADVGVVAAMYPDTTFIVYHSAIDYDPSPSVEGPYDKNNTQGTDRLIHALLKNNLVGKNLYAELGSVWAQVMNNPTMAQHVIGKLVKYFGSDHVLWGSESVWLGSPQPQIEAFRAFQISKEFQEMYGYPELTDDIKAKIFGLSAAKIYGVDPSAVRCKIKQSSLSMLKDVVDGELGGRRWSFQEMGGPRTRREFIDLARVRGNRPG